MNRPPAPWLNAGGFFNLKYLNDRDKNMIIIGGLDSENKTSIQKQKELPKHALKEIDRLIIKFGEKIS